MGTTLPLREISVDDFDASFEQLTEGYLHVRTTSLIPQTRPGFDIYFPALSKSPKRLELKKLVSCGDTYRQELHDFLSIEDVGVVYIDKDKEEVLLDYSSRNVQKLIHSSDTPIEQKTQLLYDNAEMIVRKVFNERPNRSNIAIGQQFVGTFVDHLSSSAMSAELLLSLFSKDYYTFTHSVQVALLGMTFCRFLGWENARIADFGLGALFHDVGKSSIDGNILKKPSRLDKEEFEIIKKHPMLGYFQLKKAQLLSEEQLNIVLQHHEAMDGSGYPHKLEGNEIHELARVVRLVDCFDALTTKRVYKDALPRKEALRIMTDEMGRTFDSDYLRDFIKFVQIDDKVEAATPNRIAIEVGTPVMIQFDGAEARLKATLAGMEVDRYLLLRVSDSDTKDEIRNGRQVTARYLHSGIIYGFRSQVLNSMLNPARLLFLSYPAVIENVNLRKHTRYKVDIPVQAAIRGEVYQGRALDLSGGGCRITMAVPISAITPDLIDGQISITMKLAGGDGLKDITCNPRSFSVRCNEVTVGMQFTNLGKAQAKALEHLLNRAACKQNHCLH